MEKINTTEMDLHLMAYEFCPAPIVVLSHRRMIALNNAFCQLFGYARAELIDQNIAKIFPNLEEYEKVGQDAFQALSSQKSVFYSDQRFMQHKNGQLFWTHTHGRTLTPDNPFQLMVWHFEAKERAGTPTHKLTKRESEITQFVVNGLSCKEIAKKLGLSHRTIEVHKANLMKKLKVSSKAELTSKIIIQQHHNLSA